MYTPEHFKLDDTSIIIEIIGKHPFAAIVSSGQNGLEAAHIPLLLSEDNSFLFGHMAYENPLLKEDSSVLCIFAGPHAYISPSWYETNKSVPTWNYVSVHVKGKMKLVSESETEKILQDFIIHFEEPNSGYGYDTLTPEIRKVLLTKIIGFRIEIDSIQAKVKLSQNHPMERKTRVIAKLEELGSDEQIELADWTRRMNSIPKD